MASISELASYAKSAYNQSMTFDENTVQRDRNGRFAEKNGAPSEVVLDQPVDPTLEESLRAYGLTAADVPLDHEGRTIVERWNEVFACLDEERLTTVEEYVNNELNADFGRLRGGPWLAWPEIGVPMEDWKTVRPGDDWTGRTPVAMVHTRNGGGNRECWCDDSDNHDATCLAVVVENLQNHPAHVMDEDSSMDCTYANFAFRVDREAVQTLFRTSGLSREQETARRVLSQIADGEMPPWFVFPTNPATQARIEEYRAQAADLLVGKVLKSQNQLPSGQKANSIPDERHADALRAKLAVLNGDDSAIPASDARVWYFDRHTGLKKEREAYEEAVRASEAVVAANEALADPSTPPALAHALRSALSASLGISYSAKKLPEREKALAQRRESILKDLDVVENVIRRQAMQVYIRDQISTLTQDITWPGEGPAPAKL